LAEVHQLTYGWVNPILAFVMSAVGCLLGLLLMTKARTRTGRRRLRLLSYAAVAIGGTGIWQMHFIAMLGFDVPASAVRYDPLQTAASLGIAILGVGGGLFIAGYGTLGFWRLMAAGTVVGGGIAAMHYAGMAAVKVAGVIEYEPRRFAISIGIAMAIASASLWCTAALRGFGATVLAAVVLAAAISGMHYTAMSAVRVHLVTNHVGITGVDPIFLIGPMVTLGGAAIAMVAFFTFGNSTMEEVRAIYRDGSDEATGAIETRILAEVMARVTAGMVGEPLALPAGPSTAPPAPGLASAEPTRAPGPRPTPGIKPVWRSMPAWGSPAPDNAVAEGVPVVGRLNGGRRADAPIGSASSHTLTLTPSRYPPPRPNPGQTAAPTASQGQARNSTWRNRRRRTS
jgi:NO-binding membrane sensor protein with MHYT domain